MSNMLWRYSGLLVFRLVPLIWSVNWIAGALAAGVSPPLSSYDPQRCGNLSVPYPFAVGGGRRRPLVEGLEIVCDGGGGGLPRVRLGNHSYEVVKIRLNDGKMVIRSGPVAWRCEPEGEISYGSGLIDLEGTPYTLTSDANRFRVVGCGTYGRMWNYNGGGGESWCRSLCDFSSNDVGDQGDGGTECLKISNHGCCQDLLVQMGMKRFNIEMGRVPGGNLKDVWRGCSRAFITMEDLDFSITELASGLIAAVDYMVSLDWWVGDKNCEEAKKDKRSYACIAHSTCFDAPTGVGYYCQCNEGYAGNPYLPNIGDIGNVFGTGCTKAQSLPTVVQFKRNLSVAAIIGLSSSMLALISSLLFLWTLKKRKYIRLKQKLFLRNGGLLLQEFISMKEDIDVRTVIFSIEELEKAAENFSESRIIGRGGYGTVYMGILPDQKAVAIKKSRISDESQIGQFINEVFILSQVIHKNVVRLLGCCLETEVPLLVYEFVPNGTLYDHIHGGDGTCKLSWETRLRVAKETAEALAYLHSATCVPIIHRDVKSTNILLDENCTAKVSDFGASKSVPFEHTHVTTIIQGTLGYLDPEYLHTSQLTEKSDVYSFGVVLVELLLSEKPISLNRSGKERNLAAHFLFSLEGKCLEDILDPQILEEAPIEHFYQVADVAKRCLSAKGGDRPTMREVAMELEELRMSRNQVLAEQGPTRFLETDHADTIQQRDLETGINTPLSPGVNSDRFKSNSQAATW